MKIYDCGFYGGVPEESLDGVKIGSLINKVGCKSVPQRMDTAAFVYTGFFFAWNISCEPLICSDDFQTFDRGTTICQDDIYSNRF